MLAAFKMEQMPHRVRTPAALPACLTQSRFNRFQGMGQTQLQESNKLTIPIGTMSYQIQACRLKASRQIRLPQG